MGDMAYCRYQNTYNDLRDCCNAMSEINDDELSKSEESYRRKLIELCYDIAADFSDEIEEE